MYQFSTIPKPSTYSNHAVPGLSAERVLADGIWMIASNSCYKDSVIGDAADGALKLGEVFRKFSCFNLYVLVS